MNAETTTESFTLEPPLPEDVSVTSTVVRNVARPETDASKAALADEIAALIEDEQSVIDEAKEAATAYREKRDSIHAKAAELAERIRNGHRDVAVRCLVTHDVAAFQVRYLCAEEHHPEFTLGALVEQRAMTPEETQAAMQPDLPGIESRALELEQMAEVCARCQHPRGAHRPSCVSCEAGDDSCGYFKVAGAATITHADIDTERAEALLDEPTAKPEPVTCMCGHLEGEHDLRTANGCTQLEADGSLCVCGEFRAISDKGPPRTKKAGPTSGKGKARKTNGKNGHAKA